MRDVYGSLMCKAKGLPISETVTITSELEKDGITFSSNNFKAKLPYSRILSVSFNEDVMNSESRAENYPALQAALGGILFGPTGAIVGAVLQGRKKTTWTSVYTIDIFYADVKGQQKHIIIYDTFSIDRPIAKGNWRASELYTRQISEWLQRTNPQRTIIL